MTATNLSRSDYTRLCKSIDWDSLEEVRELDSELEHVKIDPVKRFFDVVISGLLLIFMSPVFGIFYLFQRGLGLIYPQTYGPLFWYETRISEGRSFEIIKFRILRQSVIDEAGPDDLEHIKTLERHRENLTPLGRVIVMMYMDELPQLINVFTGDMSLVGPRPWPVELVENDLERGLRRKELIRPGLTGPAQISKGFEDEYEGKYEGDYRYILFHASHSSLRRFQYDLKIIVKTFRVILEAEGY